MEPKLDQFDEDREQPLELAALEADLRIALRREAAPAGFAMSVLARRDRALWWSFIPRLAPALAMLAIIVSTVSGYREVEHRKSQMAVEQTRLALRLTAEKLEFAKTKVRQHLLARSE